MKAAAVSIDITPPVGLPMGGNVREDDIARGAHDNLYCNVILLESSEEKVCFLSFDLVGLGYNLCYQLKLEVSRSTGIASEKIIVLATHTHSGPDVTEAFRERIDERCIRYFNGISVKIAQEIKLLIANLHEVNIRIGKKLVHDLSFNRRLVMKDSSMRMNWEDVDIEFVEKEAGPIDPELYVISIMDHSEKLLALIVNFTLHPAVLVGKDWLWSRDYISYLDYYIKSNLGSAITVLFANGAEGNINHINFKEKSQGRGFEEARRIGEALGHSVLEVVNNASEIKDMSIKCMSRTIELPLRSLSSEQIKWAREIVKERGDAIPSLLDGVPDEIYAREVLKLTKIKGENVKTEIQVIELGDTVIATLPGEVFVEFGLEIKEKSQYRNTLIFGLTNDCIGYIPTEQAFDEGGYEIKTAMTSKLDKKAGDILTAKVINLLSALKE